jgi:hypothetical protein
VSDGRGGKSVPVGWASSFELQPDKAAPVAAKANPRRNSRRPQSVASGVTFASESE